MLLVLVVTVAIVAQTIKILLSSRTFFFVTSSAHSKRVEGTWPTSTREQVTERAKHGANVLSSGPKLDLDLGVLALNLC